MRDAISIPARFNGPLESGQGGYVAGVIAGLVGGSAEVSIRAAVPVDRALVVERDGADGVRIVDGETLIAEGKAAPDFAIDVPPPVTVEEARRAESGYRGLPDGVFSRCFVCGRARDDAFGVFAGAVDGRDVVASAWTPPDWTAGDDGRVRPEFVWAVLDCPTFFATYLHEDLAMGVLARVAGRVDRPAIVGEDHVVIAWPIEVDGRKRHAGSALLSADGEVLAVSRALLIEPRAG